MQKNTQKYFEFTVVIIAVAAMPGAIQTTYTISIQLVSLYIFYIFISHKIWFFFLLIFGEGVSQMCDAITAIIKMGVEKIEPLRDENCLLFNTSTVYVYSIIHVYAMHVHVPYNKKEHVCV